MSGPRSVAASASAIELVEVEYEELPVIVDPFKALEPDATVLREDLNDHITALPAPVAHTMTRHLEAVDQSNRRLAKMIESVLEYARLGRVNIENQPVPLGPLLQGVISHLRQENTGRTIDWVIDDEPCEIKTTHGPVVAAEPSLRRKRHGASSASAAVTPARSRRHG